MDKPVVCLARELKTTPFSKEAGEERTR